MQDALIPYVRNMGSRACYARKPTIISINLIGLLSRTIQQYSPTGEWIMCELGIFPIFFTERPFKIRQNTRADFF